MTYKLITSISIAAMTTVFSISALAQGGDDPINGINIIMKEDPSLAPIKPFSMTPDEMGQLNRIKGVGRMELILKAASKRAKVDEGFMKSGMSVMGKDWCGECPWPETASYTFKNGEITYKLDLKYHSEAGEDWRELGKEGLRSKFIGETANNLEPVFSATQQPADEHCWGCLTAPLETNPSSEDVTDTPTRAKGNGVAAAQRALDEGSIAQSVRQPDFDFREQAVDEYK